MIKSDLIHILRAAHEIWIENSMPADEPICIVGSQSILLYFHESKLPPEATMSHEADIFLIKPAPSSTNSPTVQVIEAEIDIDLPEAPEQKDPYDKPPTKPRAVTELEERLTMQPETPGDNVASPDNPS